jgi:hypothetical protein
LKLRAIAVSVSPGRSSPRLPLVDAGELGLAAERHSLTLGANAALASPFESLKLAVTAYVPHTDDFVGAPGAGDY